MPGELDEKRIIEAALFMSGREIGLDEMRRLTGVAAFGYLQKLVQELKDEYDGKGSALEVFELSGKYGMRIRDAYVERVKQFAQETEISKSALRALAYVAKHDGVLKSELVKRMGTQVYQTVKELVGSEFVKQQRSGRSSKLFVTDKFRRYFKVMDVPVPQAEQTASQAEALVPESTPDSEPQEEQEKMEE